LGTSTNAREVPDAAVGGSVHRILRNSTFNFAAQGLNAAFNVVIVLVLARSLGVDGSGNYYKIFAWVTAVQLVVEAGTSTVLTRRLIQAPASWHETATDAAGLFVGIAGTSLGLFVAYGAISMWLRSDPTQLSIYGVAGVTCAAIQVQRYATGVFRAKESFGYENAARVLQGFAFAGVVVVVVLVSQPSLLWVLAALAVSQIIAAWFLMIALWREWPALGWKIARPQVRVWVRETFLLGVGDVVRQLTWTLDTLLLAFMTTETIVGIYSMAYRPLGPVNWLPRAILLAAFPSFARFATDSEERLRESFSNSIRLLWVLSLPITIAICFYADPIVRILAGQKYSEFAEAGVLLSILIWITLLIYISTQYRFVLAAMGKLQSYTRLVVVVFLIEAAIEAALIPRFSYYGACAGSVTGELFFTLVGLMLCRKLGVGRIDWKHMAGAAVAGGLMAALLGVSALYAPPREIGLPLMVLFTTAATLAYFGFCILFGALARQEVIRFVEALVPARWRAKAPAGERAC
jgi:PST family polysaccharide transporter